VQCAEDGAAHFIVRMVYICPQQISILVGGPRTNIALAIALDSSIPDLA
jgi:inosine-uridine nucleoside N-ribohydrolase